jgi:hypothetical protein
MNVQDSTQLLDLLTQAETAPDGRVNVTASRARNRAERNKPARTLPDLPKQRGASEQSAAADRSILKADRPERNAGMPRAGAAPQ